MPNEAEGFEALSRGLSAATPGEGNEIFPTLKGWQHGKRHETGAANPSGSVLCWFHTPDGAALNPGLRCWETFGFHNSVAAFFGLSFCHSRVW